MKFHRFISTVARGLWSRKLHSERCRNARLFGHISVVFARFSVSAAEPKRVQNCVFRWIPVIRQPPTHFAKSVFFV
jgi:hypothetical protein